MQRADKIVVLNNGKNTATGTFQELMDRGIDFLAFLKAHETTEDSHEKARKMSSLKALNKEEEAEEKARQNEQSETADRQGREEARESGSVKASVYWKYCRSGGSVFFILFAFALAFLSQGMFHYMDFWLAEWTTHNQRMNAQNLEEFEHSTFNLTVQANEASANQTTSHVASADVCYVTVDSQLYKILQYSLLMLVLFMSTFARTISFFLLCLKCCINLHNSIFRRLLRAPLQFFENNPMGELLIHLP